MASTDPILTALTLMEGRLLQRMEEWRRDFKLDLDGRFGAIHKRLDYLGRRRKPPNARISGSRCSHSAVSLENWRDG